MAIESIITIIIAVLVAVLVWGFIKRIFKLLYYVGVALLLIILVSGYLIYNDIRDFRNNFTEQTNIVLLKDNGNVLTGYTMEANPKILTKKEIDEFSELLKNDDFDKILDDNYKLMIINLDLISDLDTERISLGETRIKKESMIDILKSDEPFELFNKVIDETSSIRFDTRLENEDLEFKAALLGTIVNEELIGTENALTFLKQYKRENLIIYPETALFKAIKIIPLAFVKNTAKTLFEKTREKAKTFIVEEAE